MKDNTIKQIRLMCVWAMQKFIVTAKHLLSVYLEREGKQISLHSITRKVSGRVISCGSLQWALFLGNEQYNL